MIKKILRLASVLTLLLSMALSATPVRADGGSITLSSYDDSVASGSSFVVAVYANGGGTNINAVEADLSFSSSRLQYVGVNYSGSAFGVQAPPSISDGLVAINVGTVTPFSGSGLVATVTFRALASSGSVEIDVASSSHLVRSDTSTDLPFAPGSVTISIGGSPSSGSSAPSTPAPAKDATPPKISAIKVKNLTAFSATITWLTDEASDSVVEYGLDTNYGLSASNASPGTVHTIALQSAFLTPLTLLHYHIKSTDGAGNVAVSPDQTLQLPGISVTIVVRGPDGKPKSGVSVTLDGSTGTTDSNGKVTLASGLGSKKVTTVYQGVAVQKTISVTKSSKPLPPVQLDLSRQPLNRWMAATVGLVVVVIILLGIDAILFGSHFLRRATGLKPKPAATKSSKSFHLPGLNHSLTHRHPKPARAAPPPQVPKAEPAPETPKPAPVFTEPVMPVTTQTAKPEPLPTPEPPKPEAESEPGVPVASSFAPDPPEDAMKKVTKLMGGPPPDLTNSSPDAVSSKPAKIGHFADSQQTAPPLVIDIKPLSTTQPPVSDGSEPVKSAPSIESAKESPAAEVAHRLKKPAKAHESKPKAKKTAPKP